MASPDLAYVNPAALRWARESAGYSVKDGAKNIGVNSWQLELAEIGQEILTLRQAERAADVYARPLAALYLPEPPEEEPQEAQFRRLPGAPDPPWGAAMQHLVRRVRERQEAAVELYEVLEEDPPWPIEVRQFHGVSEEALPERARKVLGVSLAEQEEWQDGFAALRGWREAVEALGVLVMQDGACPVHELRGFASLHPLVPAIVANTKDDPRARAFTIVHELGHLVLHARGIPVGPETEQWCNDFAGDVLLPPAELEQVFATAAGRPLGRVERVARTFQVTPLAASVRVARAGLLAPLEAETVIAQIRGRVPEPSPRRGGDYYLNQIAGFGPGFLRLVFSALDTQGVTYPTASSLLDGVKVSNFDRLRAQLDRRSELA